MTSNMLINFDDSAFRRGESSNPYSDMFDSFALPLQSCESSEHSSDSVSAGSLPAADPLVVPLEAANRSVQLEVSGSSFVMDYFDFQKLAALPWKRVHNDAFRLEDANPEAFRECVDFIVFDSLPKKKKMTATEREELADMAKTLNLTELVNHMGSKRGSKQKKPAKVGPSTKPKKSRGWFGLGRKQEI